MVLVAGEWLKNHFLLRCRQHLQHLFHTLVAEDLIRGSIPVELVFAAASEVEFVHEEGVEVAHGHAAFGHDFGGHAVVLEDGAVDDGIELFDVAFEQDRRAAGPDELGVRQFGADGIDIAFREWLEGIEGSKP